MNSFINRVFLFIFIIISIVIIDLSMQKLFFFKSSNLKIPKQNSVLILGHSHPVFAVNPKYIKNSFNLSEEGEAYIYTYFKAKKVIEINPQIKKVFIEFTNNQIYKKDMDDWIWSDVHLQHRIKKYGLLLDQESLELLYKKNATGLINAFSKSLFDNSSRFINYKKNFITNGTMGGFIASEKTIEKSSISIVNKKKKSINRISEYNILYLQKIIKYCQDKGLKVCLIRTPMHKSFDVSFSEQKFQEILQSKFKKIKFLDNKDFSISDKGFQDREHLNSYGAKIYSQYLNKQINYYK